MTERKAEERGTDGLLDRLKRALEAEGLVPTARKAVERLGSVLVRRFDEIVLLQDLGDEELAEPAANLQLQPLAPDALPLLAMLVEEHADIGVTTVSTMRNYLENGFHGVVFLCNNVAVGFAWWTDAEVPTDRQHPAAERLGIPLGPDEALYFDFFLEPRSRGDGTSAKFVRHLTRLLRGRGYARAYGYVDADNIGGRVLWKIIGCKDLRRCRCVRILSFFLVVDGRLYMKNGKRSRPHTFDYRRLRLPIPGLR